MGGSKTISSDDGKQTDFEYKEKRSDGVDVYTYGVKMVQKPNFIIETMPLLVLRLGTLNLASPILVTRLDTQFGHILENTPAFQAPSIREDTIRMLSVKNAKKTLGTDIQNTTHGTLQHFRTNFTWILVGTRCIR